MAYDSPKTIRCRQQRQNDAPRKQRKAPLITTFMDDQWDEACEYHLRHIHTQIEKGDFYLAGAHAQAIAHMACQRRAYQIMTENRRDYWGAMSVAAKELYGEVDQ